MIASLHNFLSSTRCKALGILLASFILHPSSSLVAQATPPSWWATYNVTNADPAEDTAAANVGQARHVATQAKAYFDATFASQVPNYASLDNDIEALFTEPWFANGTYDTQALLIGQLKYIAAPFYDLLNHVDVAYDTTALVEDPQGQAPSIYPWKQPPTDITIDTQLATLGQLKYIFGFDLSGWSPGVLPPDSDADGDGLTNSQEIAFGSNPNLIHSDADSLDDYQEFHIGTDPNTPNTVSNDTADTTALVLWMQFR